MRTSAIIRIVTGSIVAVLLTAILAACLMGVNLPRFFRALRADVSFDEALHGSVSDTQSDALTPFRTASPDGAASSGGAARPTGEAVSASTEDEVALAADGIKKIKIQWVAGDVQLAADAGNDIRFSETADRALSNTQRLRYSVQGDTLKISYCDDTFNTWNWLDLDRFNIPAKRLTVTLPTSLTKSLSSLELELVSADFITEGLSLSKLEVESISGDISVSGATLSELDAQSVSGRIALLQCTALKLDMETVSGKAEATGAFGEVDCEGVSGELTVTTSVAPKEAELNTVSGRIRFNIPADTGFTAKYETVSGDVSCAISGTMRKNGIVCGNGACDYSFETVSGDVDIGIS